VRAPGHHHQPAGAVPKQALIVEQLVNRFGPPPADEKTAAPQPPTPPASPKVDRRSRYQRAKRRK